MIIKIKDTAYAVHSPVDTAKMLKLKLDISSEALLEACKAIIDTGEASKWHKEPPEEYVATGKFKIFFDPYYGEVVPTLPNEIYFKRGDKNKSEYIILDSESLIKPDKGKLFDTREDAMLASIELYESFIAKHEASIAALKNQLSKETCHDN